MARYRAALTGVVVGAALATGGCSIFEDPARDDDTGQMSKPGDVSVFDLAVGDCLRGYADGAELADVAVMPCSAEHGDEIFAAVALPDGAYPGSDRIRVAATAQCAERFEAFVGIEPDDSDLVYGHLSPTPRGWERGDRTILCTVGDPRGPTTGTLRGSRR